MLAKDQNKKKDPKLMTDSPVLDLNNSAIKSLIKKGKLNGFVTLDELNAALPPGEYTSEQIEDIHSAINEMGFNIVDQQEETTPPNANADGNPETDHRFPRQRRDRPGRA